MHESTSLPCKDLYKLQRLQWIDQYRFESLELKDEMIKLAKDLNSRGLIDIATLWRGSFYKKEILENRHEHLSIRWLDASLGCGVFANKDLKEGDYIGCYLGKLGARFIWQECQNAYCFLYPIQPSFFYKLYQGCWNANALICGNHTRFINHSENANANAYAAYVNSFFYIVIIASRRIERGEQISYDYGSTYWNRRHDKQNLN
jgi:hypothetical protein